ncbi:mitochondrial 39-S ribosomal protein L47 (MRP-L47)-domain-containing protein, partial [Mycena filopes]
DHGLYGFFRRKDGPHLRGDDQYETFTDPLIKYTALIDIITGRSWEASELRLKSFKDLHTLWYVLLREANLLATQREEMRQLGGQFRKGASRPLHLFRADAMLQVRKSMARIKAVMNERRLAYEGALELVEKERDEGVDAEVL